jgi:hypothetical protein
VSKGWLHAGDGLSHVSSSWSPCNESSTMIPTYKGGEVNGPGTQQQVAVRLDPQAFFCLFACSTEVWTVGLVLARLALYHMSYADSPFCSGYFGDRISLFAPAGLDHILLFMQPAVKTGWQVHCTIPNFSLLRQSLAEFLLRVSSNSNFPNLHFPSS